MKLDFKSRQSGFAADILNLMLKDLPSGNLNWDFFGFSPLNHILAAGCGSHGLG